MCIVVQLWFHVLHSLPFSMSRCYWTGHWVGTIKQNVEHVGSAWSCSSWVVGFSKDLSWSNSLRRHLLVHFFFWVGLYTYTSVGWAKGCIVLGKGVRISRVGKGHWLRAKALICLISIGRHPRNLRWGAMWHSSGVGSWTPTPEEEAPLTKGVCHLALSSGLPSNARLQP